MVGHKEARAVTKIFARSGALSWLNRPGAVRCALFIFVHLCFISGYGKSGEVLSPSDGNSTSLHLPGFCLNAGLSQRLSLWRAANTRHEIVASLQPKARAASA